MASPNQLSNIGHRVADRIKTQPNKAGGLGQTSARVFKSQIRNSETLSRDGFTLNPTDLPNSHVKNALHK